MSDYPHWRDMVREYGPESFRARLARARSGEATYEHAYVHPGPQDCADYKQCHERAYGTVGRWPQAILGTHWPEGTMLPHAGKIEDCLTGGCKRIVARARRAG